MANSTKTPRKLQQLRDQLVLDWNAGDDTARLALADTYEEEGDLDTASGLRGGTILEFGDRRVRLDNDRGIYLWVYLRKTGRCQSVHGFSSVENREVHISWIRKTEREKAQRRAERKQAEADARASFVNPHKVGDLLVNTWGYDCTIVDFYQVVKVGPRSVTLRKIGGRTVGTYQTGGRVVAQAGEFIGEPFTVVFQVPGGCNPYLPARHGTYSPYDGRPMGFSEY